MKPGYANFRYSPGEQHRRELIAKAALAAQVREASGDPSPSRNAQLRAAICLVGANFGALVRLIALRPRRLEADMGNN